MSVIIDQFEVILDSQEDKQSQSSAASGEVSQAQSLIKPLDVASIIKQMQNRCARVRAH